MTKPSPSPVIQSRQKHAPWCQAPGSAGRPPPGVGLVVAANGEAASLWLIGLLPNAGSLRPLEQASQAAWFAAFGALTRALPLLWQPLQQLQRAIDTTRAYYLGGLRGEHDAETTHDPNSLSGGSLGLTAGLCLVSYALDLPLPADLLASAQLAADGTTAPVAGFAAKLKGVLACAPSVTRVLVHPHNVGGHNEAEDAEQILGSLPNGSRLALLKAASLADAIRAAWSEAQLQAALDQQLHDTSKRAALVDMLFQMAQGERRAALTWTPIANTAQRALDASPDAYEAHKLRFTFAVARRYMGHDSVLELPDRAWLDALPQPNRTLYLAHAAQNAAMCGSPDPREIERVAQEVLPARLEDHFEPHLKLRGALGRLLAHTGRLSEGLLLQQEVANAWLERRAYGDVSYPLCEWFRLAALPEAVTAQNLDLRVRLDQAPSSDELQGCAALLQTAERIYQAVLRWDPRAYTTYMDLYRCRAWLLQPSSWSTQLDEGWVVGRLQGLWDNRLLEDNVRWVAARLLVQALRRQGGADKHAQMLAQCQEQRKEAKTHADQHAEVQCALVSLDEALVGGVEGEVTGAVGQIRALVPGLVGLMERSSGQEGVELARWLARTFPR